MSPSIATAVVLDTARTESDADAFTVIAAALSETERGRQFLQEFARRAQREETGALLAAIETLQGTIARMQSSADIPRLRMDLMEMAKAIARTRAEIAAIRPPQTDDSKFNTATEELDAIVTSTERATEEILAAAEHIQDITWTLREQGAPADLCDTLESRAIDIYTACSFQDITGQRTGKVVAVLRYLEMHVNAMVSIWGLEDDPELAALAQTFEPQDRRPDAHLLNGPQLDGQGLGQGDVDSMMDFSRSPVDAFEAAPADMDQAALDAMDFDTVAFEPDPHQTPDATETVFLDEPEDDYAPPARAAAEEAGLEDWELAAAQVWAECGADEAQNSTQAHFDSERADHDIFTLRAHVEDRLVPDRGGRAASQAATLPAAGAPDEDDVLDLGAFDRVTAERLFR